MSEWEQGDTATLVLDVDPADDTTLAIVAITSPSGVLYAPVALPNVARDRWTVQIVVDEPGVWDVLWTVTGTGAGVEPYEQLLVAPVDVPVGARVYATSTDLANYVDAAPPAGASRLLVRASADVDALLVGARYATDTGGMPTGAPVIAALREATCAQAVLLSQRGGGEDGTGAYSSVQIGSVRLSASSGSIVTGPNGRPIAAATMNTLHVAGLLPIVPYAYG